MRGWPQSVVWRGADRTAFQTRRRVLAGSAWSDRREVDSQATVRVARSVRACPTATCAREGGGPVPPGHAPVPACPRSKTSRWRRHLARASPRDPFRFRAVRGVDVIARCYFLIARFHFGPSHCSVGSKIGGCRCRLVSVSGASSTWFTAIGGNMAKIETILVVGGGIAGLTTAAALHRHGFTTELVERQQDLARFGGRVPGPRQWHAHAALARSRGGRRECRRRLFADGNSVMSRGPAVGNRSRGAVGRRRSLRRD